MRSYKEIEASARDGSPFSNGTEGYGWMENWCFAPCQQPDEVAWQRYEAGLRKTNPGGGCPLLLCALMGKTPIEWLDQWKDGQPYPMDRYHCIEFKPPGGGGDDDPFSGPPAHPPRGKREPKDMDGLFPRPQRRVRMLKQPQPQEVLV
jgi:hypothetical protein